MSQEAYIRSSLALMMANLFPPLIQQEAMQDAKFAADLNLINVVSVTYNRTGPTFNQSALMAAVRSASIGQKSEIQDEASKTWEIIFDRSDFFPRVSIESSGEVISVNHLGAASEDRDDRIRLLNAEANRVNLPIDSRLKWSSILWQRAMTEAEVQAFAFDLSETPAGARAQVAAELRYDYVPFDALVPRSLVYYERLVGRVGEQETIFQYADEVGADHMAQLLTWDAEEGMKQCLLLCVHPQLVEVLGKFPQSMEHHSNVVDWCTSEGDAIARCAIVELSILRAESDDRIAKALLKVVRSLIDDREGEKFEILSALFMLVYGQLARTKALAGKPTFWRRLAALAHASLLARYLSSVAVKPSEIAATFKKLRSRPFAIQVFADMRSDPLWQAQMAGPEQLKNEFVGRLLYRAHGNPNETQALGLQECILGEGAESLKSTVSIMLATLPGPLEGNIALRDELPRNLHEAAENDLRQERPDASSFGLLLSTISIVRLEFELVELAVAALRRMQFQIDLSGSDVPFVPFIAGLASVAAISRNTAMGDAVTTMIRIRRQVAPADLSLFDAVGSGIVACASRSELSEWCEAIGDLMSYFAFQHLSKNEAASLRAFVAEFCDVVPELWARCSPALAALEAAQDV